MLLRNIHANRANHSTGTYLHIQIQIKTHATPSPRYDLHYSFVYRNFNTLIQIGRDVNWQDSQLNSKSHRHGYEMDTISAYQLIKREDKYKDKCVCDINYLFCSDKHDMIRV